MTLSLVALILLLLHFCDCIYFAQDVIWCNPMTNVNTSLWNISDPTKVSCCNNQCTNTCISAPYSTITTTASGYLSSYNGVQLLFDLAMFQLPTGSYCKAQYKCKQSNVWHQYLQAYGHDGQNYSAITKVMNIGCPVDDPTPITIRFTINASDSRSRCALSNVCIKGTLITEQPTITPTSATVHPSDYPSLAPTNPTDAPTEYPTDNPIKTPTVYPSETPTVSPTNPTNSPIKYPSESPITNQPTTTHPSPVTNIPIINKREDMVIVVMAIIIILLLGVLCCVVIRCRKNRNVGQAHNYEEIQREGQYNAPEYIDGGNIIDTAGNNFYSL